MAINISSLLNKAIETGKEKTMRRGKTDILVIDGLNAFIRVFSVSPRMDTDGEHIGGLVGFLNVLAKVSRELQPQKIIVVFDGPHSRSKRKKIFDGYKANRGTATRVNRTYGFQSADEEEKAKQNQIVRLLQYLDFLPVTTICESHMEADDVISLIVQELREAEDERHITIMSSDKDFLQLVSDTVAVFNPISDIRYTQKEIVDSFGVHPQNFLLYRALDGDTSDNVPGIKGMGTKTILKHFPELSSPERITPEEMFERVEEKLNTKKPPKVLQTLNEGRDIVYRNIEIMSLEEPLINPMQKLGVISRLESEAPELDKRGFIKHMVSDRTASCWKDPMSWLHKAFAHLDRSEGL